jgi:hypothetical protein
MLRDGFTNMVTNWNNDMVFDLSLQSSPVLPDENYYVTEWSSLWPGNVDGCYCSVSNVKRKVYIGLKDKPCNYNETLTGCRDISGTSPQTMNKWRSSQTIYAIRGRSTSFSSNYKNINSDGSCAKGFRLCGSKNSKSKGLCIPDKYSKCPISDIQKTNPGGYSSLALNSLTLYYSNSNQYNSVCDLVYSQAFTCFIRSQYATSPGRVPYLLLKGDQTSCIQDPNVWSVDEIGETDLLTLNNINYAKLLTFETSNNWRWQLSVGRFIDWSPDCKDTVPSISDKTDDLNSIANQYLTMFVLYIISFVMTIISLLARTLSCVQEMSKPYKWCVFIRVVAFTLIAPSLIICTAKASQFLSFFKSIIELGCSNDTTNSILARMAEDIREKIVSKTVLFTIMGFGAFFCDIITVCIDLNCGFVGSSKSEVNPQLYTSPASNSIQPVENSGANYPEQSHMIMYAKPKIEDPNPGVITSPSSKKEIAPHLLTGLPVTGTISTQPLSQQYQPSAAGQQSTGPINIFNPAAAQLPQQYPEMQQLQPAHVRGDIDPKMMPPMLPLIRNDEMPMPPISNRDPPIDQNNPVKPEPEEGFGLFE